MSPFVAEWFWFWRHFVNSSLTSSLFQNAVNWTLYIVLHQLSVHQFTRSSHEWYADAVEFSCFVFSFPGCGQTLVGDIGVTVEPRFNEPRFNEDLVITNNIWKPGRISVKYMETNPAITNPAITNWFWWSQRTIYPAITNILSFRSQSVKTTWWYKWLIRQTHLLLVTLLN